MPLVSPVVRPVLRTADPSVAGSDPVTGPMPDDAGHPGCARRQRDDGRVDVVGQRATHEGADAVRAGVPAVGERRLDPGARDVLEPVARSDVPVRQPERLAGVPLVHQHAERAVDRPQLGRAVDGDRHRGGRSDADAAGQGTDALARRGGLRAGQETHAVLDDVRGDAVDLAGDALAVGQLARGTLALDVDHDRLPAGGRPVRPLLADVDPHHAGPGDERVLHGALRRTDLLAGVRVGCGVLLSHVARLLNRSGARQERVKSGQIHPPGRNTPRDVSGCRGDAPLRRPRRVGSPAGARGGRSSPAACSGQRRATSIVLVGVVRVVLLCAGRPPDEACL